jgi:lycopene beta-cyclase
MGSARPNVEQTEKRYDIVIIGGGASGLSLACHLVNSPLRDSSILIVEKSPQVRDDRTWAFWTKTPTLFDAITCRSWHKLLIASGCKEQTLRLGPYNYKAIRGVDFTRCAREELSRFPNVEFVHGRADAVEDDIEGATVSVQGRDRKSRYKGRLAFDSRFNLSSFHPQPGRYRYLKMQFLGWEIETPAATFDPQTPIFLDFRTPQRGQLRFFYLLPYSDRRALVEYVVCTNELLHRAEQEQAIATYAREILKIEDYNVVATEHGINPMTDYRFPRRTGRHIMSIGVPAGMLKPTTGFAFTRIQRDSAAIVRSLVKRGHPFAVPSSRWGYLLYDSVMLRAIAHHGGRIGSLLAFLFRYGSTPSILRFLDERGVPY